MPLAKYVSGHVVFCLFVAPMNKHRFLGGSTPYDITPARLESCNWKKIRLHLCLSVVTINTSPLSRCTYIHIIFKYLELIVKSIPFLWDPSKTKRTYQIGKITVEIISLIIWSIYMYHVYWGQYICPTQVYNPNRMNTIRLELKST